MRIHIIFIGLGIFIFLFLGFYLFQNMHTFQKASVNCVSNGGECIDKSLGCGEGMMVHPEAECHDDANKLCCIRY